MGSVRDYERVFTPSAPVRTRKLFLGRVQEEADIQATFGGPEFTRSLQGSAA